MKTIQELYNEVMANEELKAQCIEAAKAGKFEAFLKEQGCDAALDEVAAFLKAKAEEDAPLSLNELNQAAGGKDDGDVVDHAVSWGGLGVGCIFMTVVSTTAEAAGTGYFGRREKNDNSMCNLDSIKNR